MTGNGGTGQLFGHGTTQTTLGVGVALSGSTGVVTAVTLSDSTGLVTGVTPLGFTGLVTGVTLSDSTGLVTGVTPLGFTGLVTGVTLSDSTGRESSPVSHAIANARRAVTVRAALSIFVMKAPLFRFGS